MAFALAFPQYTKNIRISQADARDVSSKVITSPPVCFVGAQGLGDNRKHLPEYREAWGSGDGPRQSRVAGDEGIPEGKGEQHMKGEMHSSSVPERDGRSRIYTRGMVHLHYRT